MVDKEVVPAGSRWQMRKKTLSIADSMTLLNPCSTKYRSMICESRIQINVQVKGPMAVMIDLFRQMSGFGRHHGLGINALRKFV